MTWLDISLPLGLGLASSLHCAQMCGPLVVSYSLGSGGGWRAHVAYNLGRIATYSAMGAAAGLIGAMVGGLGRWAGIEQAALLVAGALMIIAGIFTAGFLPASGLVQIGGGGISGLFTKTIGRLISSKAALSKLGLGALLGFLPCGLVYAALLKAMAADGALAGAATMALFGLGTSAALIGIGLFSSVIGARLGKYSNAIAAASMMVMGAFLLWHGLKPVTTGESCHHH
jgi:hypothetical protein